MSPGLDHVLKSMGVSLKPKVTGWNGSEIKGLGYDQLSPHARYVVNKIKRNISEQFWDPGRDNVTVFGNKGKDLPEVGTYKEFTVLATDASYSSTFDQLATTIVPMPGIAGGAKARKAALGDKDRGDVGVAAGYGTLGSFAGGVERIVYDSAGSKFYYTPTHYVGHKDEAAGVYYNPFFLITDIPADSQTFFGPGF